MRKSTRPTVAPLVAVAVAVTLTDTPRGRVSPAAGAVIETVGTVLATVAETANEVTTAEFESVTRAVSETAPVAVGVQLTL